MSLAPKAVLPSLQRQDIGSELEEAGLEACRERSHKIVVVLSHSTSEAVCRCFSLVIPTDYWNTPNLFRLRRLKLDERIGLPYP